MNKNHAMRALCNDQSSFFFIEFFLICLWCVSIKRFYCMNSVQTQRDREKRFIENYVNGMEKKWAVMSRHLIRPDNIKWYQLERKEREQKKTYRTFDHMQTIIEIHRKSSAFRRISHTAKCIKMFVFFHLNWFQSFVRNRISNAIVPILRNSSLPLSISHTLRLSVSRTTIAWLTGYYFFFFHRISSIDCTFQLNAFPFHRCDWIETARFWVF